jgi:hypothetical protein
VNSDERFSYRTAVLELGFFAWPFIAAALIVIWMRD